MVEIRVAVADATGVHGLARRLASVFDWSSVSFDEPGKEVRVRSECWSRAPSFLCSTLLRRGSRKTASGGGRSCRSAIAPTPWSVPSRSRAARDRRPRAEGFGIGSLAALAGVEVAVGRA